MKLRSPFQRSTSPSRKVPSAFAVYYVDGEGRMAAIKGDSQANWIPGEGVKQAGLQATDSGFASAYLASEWVFRCLNIRATKVAELLNDAQLVDPAGDVLPAPGLHPFYQAIDLAYTRYYQDYYFQYLIQLDLFGEAFHEKIKGQSPMLGPLQRAWAVRVLPSLAVEPYIVRGEIVSFDYASDEGSYRFRPEQIAYDFTFNPRATLRGVSLLEGALKAVNLDLAVVRQNLSYFQNGARPAFIIAPKVNEQITDADKENLRTWLAEKLTGVAKWYKPLLLTKPVDVTMVQYPSLEDQQFLTEDQRERICAKCEVPIGMVTFSDQPYQLSPQQRIALYENTLLPLANHAIRFLNTNVLPFFGDGAQLRLDPDKVAALVEDETQKDQIVQARYESGRITFNEMRKALRLDEKPDGDFLLFPTGKTAVAVDHLASMVERGEQTPLVPPLAFQLGDAALPHLAPPSPSHPLALPPGGAPALPTLSRGNGHGRRSKSSFGVPDGTVVLYLDHVEGLLMQQQALQRALPSEARIRWTPREQLHVTLVHAALVDELEFKTAFDRVAATFTGLDLTTSRVTTFPVEGAAPVPIIALVDPTEELKTLQARVYQQFFDLAIRTSEYSDPAQWTPHITLGYLDTDQAASWAAALDQPQVATVHAASLEFTRGAYETVDLQHESMEPDDAERELRAWRRVTLRKGHAKGLAFTALHTPAVIAEAVKMNLAVLDAADRDGQADLFRRAVEWLAVLRGAEVYPEGKAIQATRLEFEAAITDLVASARGEDITPDRWKRLMRSLIRRWGERAYRDGLADGGVESEEPHLEPEDQAEVNRLLADQSAYVSGLAEVLFQGDGLSDAQAAHKPDMWFHKSIMPLYQAGRMSADKNGMYEWLIGRTEEHCDTCLTATTQRHRLRDWYRAGVIPQADRLFCHGFLCDCKLVRTSERARGKLSLIPLLDLEGEVA